MTELRDTLLIPMETAYIIENIALAEPSLKRNIVAGAQRIENFASLPWRTQPDALWGHLPDSSVLQETEIEMALAKTGLLLSTFNLFSSRGFNSCYYLCLIGLYYPEYQKDGPPIILTNLLKDLEMRGLNSQYLCGFLV